MKCLIVDDEPLSREIILNYCSEISYIKVVGTCSNALQASEFLENNRVDLMFLDINMPKMTGIDFLLTLKKRPQVIFTTAYSEYAVKGFELEALDYLLKPFSFERFFQSIQRAKNQSRDSNQPGCIFLKADKKTYKIDLKDIQYIEAMGDFLKVHIKDHKTLLLSETMKNILSMVPEGIFIRIHKSYIISSNHLDFIEGNRISVANDMLPIGLAFREDVREFFGLLNKKK